MHQATIIYDGCTCMPTLMTNADQFSRRSWYFVGSRRDPTRKKILARFRQGTRANCLGFPAICIFRASDSTVAGRTSPREGGNTPAPQHLSRCNWVEPSMLSSYPMWRRCREDFVPVPKPGSKTSAYESRQGNKVPVSANILREIRMLLASFHNSVRCFPGTKFQQSMLSLINGSFTFCRILARVTAVHLAIEHRGISPTRRSSLL